MASPPRLRGYVVERPLGSGASGDVWQARAAASGARVALKRICVRDDEQLRRAQAEAGLLAALDHPNLVRLHTAVLADDALVLVLDLADGGSLAGLLEARGRLSTGETVTAIAPVAAALEYLHGEGVVHGDVSAANILFTGSGVPLLADVGVARLTGDDADAEATPAYVDPAVAAGCVPGPQSDVFMLGAVALHALTGAPAWPDHDADAALARAARGVLTDVADRLRAAGVPLVMSAVLGRALAVDPQRRGTAAALALDLAHSADPAAVELAAGLPRRDVALRTGPRHAAAPGRATGTGTDPARSADPARPAFERPSVASGAGQLPPPTRLVARPRPVIPRPPRRRIRAGRLAAALGLALAAAMAAIGAAWASSAHHAGHGPATTAQPRAQVETPVGSAAHPTARPAPRPTDWAAELGKLDALRAAAFATRNGELLRRVYTPGRLLSADTALLTRIVPRGCGLAGVHTRYQHMRVARSGSRVTLVVQAALAPSRLVCGARPARRAPGIGPTLLRVVLVATPEGLRIAAEQPVSGSAARFAARSPGRGG